MNEPWSKMSEVQDEPVSLTPEGEARRRRMLEDLHAALDRRRATRRRRRWAAGGFGVAVAAVIVAGVATREPTAGSGGAAGGGLLSATGGAVRVEGVATDPAIADRLSRGTARPPRVTILSDDELVALACAEGVGRGLIRTGSSVRLVGLEGNGATASPP